MGTVAKRCSVVHQTSTACYWRARRAVLSDPEIPRAINGQIIGIGNVVDWAGIVAIVSVGRDHR
ncbi:MAG: hypothetical protein R2867_31995 [Caldilineaceae bacterium]